MNKTDNTKQVQHGILTVKKMFKLTQTGTTTIKLSKKSTSKHQLLYKLCFTVEQPLVHETAGLLSVTRNTCMQ
jgi:hypothetical protein